MTKRTCNTPIALLAWIALLLVACGQGVPADTATPAGIEAPATPQSRDQLTVAALQLDALPPLVAMRYFAQPTTAGDAIEGFSGALRWDERRATFPLERAFYDGEDLFPALQLDFISHAGMLIPVQSGLIDTEASGGSMWDVFVGTGAVWHEAGDGAWNRASFPLSLTDRYMGQVRNCVGTFVYQAQTVSNVYVQCSQETADLADGQVGDLRVLLAATYTPQTYANAAQVIAANTRYAQARLPVRPLSEIDPDGAIGAIFDEASWTNASTSLGAVVRDGTLYAHPPATRHGPYPYPDEMRHGVYSVTKSMAGALALFYLAERYDDGVVDARVTDYVPALANHPAWQGVTFGNALDMATGTEGSERPEHLFQTIVLARSAEQAIRSVARLGDYPQAPGEAFNYASTNIFVLSYAMQRYVERREGPGVSYWALVENEVLTPIGAGHFDVLHTTEPDGTRGIPFLAYGARPTRDEAAKIALLFANDGVHDGRQLLQRALTREALGREAWTGYQTGERGVRYRHAFWSRTVGRWPCRAEIAYMYGHGANTVLFLPDDVIVIRLMDENDADVARLARQVGVCG